MVAKHHDVPIATFSKKGPGPFPSISHNSFEWAAEPAQKQAAPAPNSVNLALVRSHYKV